jgi:hypothetical protein
MVGKNSNIEVEDVEDAGHIWPLRGKKGLKVIAVVAVPENTCSPLLFMYVDGRRHLL